jgi:hypothetical protein
VLVSSRKIPRIGGALLLLGGCGGDEPVDSQSVSEEFCKDWQGCDADSFDEHYDSMAECVDANIDELESYVNDYEDVACGDALVEYYHCVHEAINGCDPDDLFTYNDTKRQRCIDTFNDVCPDGDL